MSSTSKGEQRYPKRQRTAVAYNDSLETQGDLGEDSETIDVVSNNDDASSTDDGEDWAQKPNSKKRSRRSRRSKKPKARKLKVKKPKPFRFLDLPAELREEVYKLVVGNSDGIVKIDTSALSNVRFRRSLYESSTTLWMKDTGRRRFRNLRFLRVSKLIYQEAAVVMYTKQKFIFTRLAALQTFLLLVRPETLDRLIHVYVEVGTTEWQLMPGVASQMLQLHYLQTLEISGLRDVTRSRNFEKYLHSTGRPLNTWKVSLRSLDKMMGIKLARDLYPFMYPFFNAIIRAGTAAAKKPQPAESNEPEPASSRASQPDTTKHSARSLAQEPGADTDDEEETLYKRLVGVDALVQAMKLDQDSYRSWQNVQWLPSAYHIFRDMAMTEKRSSRRRTAMKEELLALMAKDTF